jgi:hypothetical protein
MNLGLGILALLGVGLVAWFTPQYLAAKNESEEERRKRRGLIPPLIGLGALLATLTGALGFAFGGSGLSVAQKDFGLKFAPAKMEAKAGELSVAYPGPGELLDAQDFLLEGTGPASLDYTVFANGAELGKTVSDEQGRWSYLVSSPKPGDYEFEIRPEGSAEGAKVTVNVAPNRPEASNARCPCKFRVFTFAPNATIELVRDGQVIRSGEGPVQVFRDLEAGDVTVRVLASGYASYASPAGKFAMPKNKNVSVYLNQAR